MGPPGARGTRHGGIAASRDYGGIGLEGLGKMRSWRHALMAASPRHAMAAAGQLAAVQTRHVDNQ